MEKVKARWTIKINGGKVVVKEGLKVKLGDALVERDGSVAVSPVDAVVVAIDEEKITLEFPAYKFDCVARDDGEKVWGKGFFRLLTRPAEVNFEMEDGIVFTDCEDPVFILKCEAIGVSGVVRVGKDLKKTEWEKMETRFASKDCRVLQNTKDGRLLVVVQ